MFNWQVLDIPLNSFTGQQEREVRWSRQPFTTTKRLLPRSNLKLYQIIFRWIFGAGVPNLHILPPIHSTLQTQLLPTISGNAPHTPIWNYANNGDIPMEIIIFSTQSREIMAKSFCFTTPTDPETNWPNPTFPQEDFPFGNFIENNWYLLLNRLTSSEYKITLGTIKSTLCIFWNTKSVQYKYF